MLIYRWHISSIIRINTYSNHLQFVGSVLYIHCYYFSCSFSPCFWINSIIKLHVLRWLFYIRIQHIGFLRQRHRLSFEIHVLRSESYVSIPGESFVAQMQLHVLTRCLLCCSSSLFGLKVSIFQSYPIYELTRQIFCFFVQSNIRKTGKTKWTAFQLIFFYSIYEGDQFTTVVVCDAIIKSITSPQGIRFPRVTYTFFVLIPIFVDLNHLNENIEDLNI